jgi:hypothetical protein
VLDERADGLRICRQTRLAAPISKRLQNRPSCILRAQRIRRVLPSAITCHSRNRSKVFSAGCEAGAGDNSSGGWWVNFIIQAYRVLNFTCGTCDYRGYQIVYY